jgi:hypothetical protein
MEGSDSCLESVQVAGQRGQFGDEMVVEALVGEVTFHQGNEFCRVALSLEDGWVRGIALGSVDQAEDYERQILTGRTDRVLCFLEDLERRPEKAERTDTEAGEFRRRVQVFTSVHAIQDSPQSGQTDHFHSRSFHGVFTSEGVVRQPGLMETCFKVGDPFHDVGPDPVDARKNSFPGGTRQSGMVNWLRRSEADLE